MSGPAATGVEALYPFLYGPGGATTEEGDDLMAAAVRSAGAKVSEIDELRARLVRELDPALQECAGALAGSFAAGGRLHVFGNGGSSTDAAAVAAMFAEPPWGRPLPAVDLTAEVAVITALANDVSFDVVFARQLAASARPGDVALGLSTSGGSENVVQALAEAGRRGLVTVGLAGYDGGRMAGPGLVEHLFVVPSSSVHRIQEAQTTLYRELWVRTQKLVLAR